MKKLVAASLIALAAAASTAQAGSDLEASSFEKEDHAWTFWGTHNPNRGAGSATMPGLSKDVCLKFLDHTNRMEFEHLQYPYQSLMRAVGVGCYNTATGEVISPALAR